MIVSTLILAANAAAESTSADSSLLAPAIIAAIVAGAVALTTFVLAARRARLDRQRQLFADAFAAVMEYREFPFVIRRRNPDELPKERQRISTDLSEVQVKLTALQGSLRVEAPEVGKRYAELVEAARRIVGPVIRAAWDTDPVAEDADIHAPPYDFGELERYDDGYLRAVVSHLDWIPPWARRSDE